LSLDVVAPTVPPAEGLIDLASVGRTFMTNRSPRDRQIVALALRDRPPAEIAEVVGETPETVRKVLSRIRKKLLAEMSAASALLGLVAHCLSRLRFWRSPDLHAVVRTISAQCDQSSPLGVTAPFLIALLTLTAVTPTKLVPPSSHREHEQIAVGPSKGLPVMLQPLASDDHSHVATGSDPPPSGRHTIAMGGKVLDSQAVHLTTAVGSPNYAEDHTIVAAGTDQACSCWRTWQSTDGGDNWVVGSAPLRGVVQLFLPSRFPNDPEIFASDGSELWRAARFGQGFLPVGGMAGLPALSASFSSDHTAFVANSQGVWRESVQDSSASLAIVSPNKAQTGSIVTGTGTGNVVLAWIFGTAAAAGPLGGSLEPSASLQGGIYSCDELACRYLTVSPLPGPGILVASPSASTDLRFAAMGIDSMALSVDGGNSFKPVPLPTGAAALLSLALTANEIWSTTQDTSGSVHVFRRSDNDAAWEDVTTGSVAVNGTLVALPDGSVMDLLGQHGFWCLRPNAKRWQVGCAGPT